jgi:hypothetical protein
VKEAEARGRAIYALAIIHEIPCTKVNFIAHAIALRLGPKRLPRKPLRWFKLLERELSRAGGAS